MALVTQKGLCCLQQWSSLLFTLGHVKCDIGKFPGAPAHGPASLEHQAGREIPLEDALPRESVLGWAEVAGEQLQGSDKMYREQEVP